MSAGLFTILDCWVDNAPFAARMLHEVVHHWVHAMREVFAFSPGKSLAMALTLVRRYGLDETIPWGDHRFDMLQHMLNRLQAAWVKDGDLDPELSGRVQSPNPNEDGIFSALQAVGTACNGDTQSIAEATPSVELWTFRAGDLLRILSNMPTSPVERLTARGVKVTLVSLSTAGQACDKQHAGVPPGLEVVSLAASRIDVLRHIRRHLGAHLTANLHLGLGFGQQSSRTRFAMPHAKHRINTQLCGPAASMAAVPPVRCRCASVVLLTAPQREAATAAVGRQGAPVVEFEFERFVRKDDVQVYHLFGVPLVVRPEGAAGGSDLIARLAEKREELPPDARARVAFQTFTSGIRAADAVAIFTAQVCPMELSLGQDRFFFVAMPGGPSSLVLQGLIFHDIASPALPLPPMLDHRDVNAASSRQEKQGHDTRSSGFALDWWRLEDRYNPLQHNMEPALVEVESEAYRERSGATPANQCKTSAAHAPAQNGRGGRGRPSAKTSSAPAVVTGVASKGAEAQRQQMPQGERAPPMPASGNPTSCSAPVGATGKASEPKATLTGLAATLRQPKRKRHIDCVDSSHSAAKSRASTSEAETGRTSMPGALASELTAKEVESIAAGLFEFSF